MRQHANTNKSGKTKRRSDQKHSVKHEARPAGINTETRLRRNGFLMTFSQVLNICSGCWETHVRPQTQKRLRHYPQTFLRMKPLIIEKHTSNSVHMQPMPSETALCLSPKIITANRASTKNTREEQARNIFDVVGSCCLGSVARTLRQFLSFAFKRKTNHCARKRFNA